MSSCSSPTTCCDFVQSPSQVTRGADQPSPALWHVVCGPGTLCLAMDGCEGQPQENKEEHSKQAGGALGQMARPRPSRSPRFVSHSHCSTSSRTSIAKALLMLKLIRLFVFVPLADRAPMVHFENSATR